MIELSLTALQQETCRNALQLAKAISSAEYAAIRRVFYAPASLTHEFMFETFEQRMTAAAATFHAAQDVLIKNDDESRLLGSVLVKFKKTSPSELFRLDDQQAHALRGALDLLSRMHLGQFHIALEGRQRTDRPQSHTLYESWLHRCNGSFGIYHPSISDEARIAWDIHKVIRHHYAWLRNPRGDITLDFDRPVAAGREPLPVVVQLAGAQ